MDEPVGECPICGKPRRKKLSRQKGYLVTCGDPQCAYEARAQKTRGNIYGDTGGGPARKMVVGYTGAHNRARKDLPKGDCSLADETCKGRLEAALRPDAPREHLYQDEKTGSMYYSGPDSSEGYRYLCRSHHVREGAAIQVIARISDPDLAEAVRKDLGL